MNIHKATDDIMVTSLSTLTEYKSNWGQTSGEAITRQHSLKGKCRGRVLKQILNSGNVSGETDVLAKI